MYFVIRNGEYTDMTRYTFRQFLTGETRKEMPDVVPSIGDWANHLSTLFPDVRLKRFLEMRGADGGPWRRICALPAFWVGLLYDGVALDACWEMVKDWTEEERQALRNAVPKTALKTPFRKTTVLHIARGLVSLAKDALMRRKRLNRDGKDETIYLAALEEIVASGETPAERLLREYETDWQGDIDEVFRRHAY
jgi:glutamate--cysteine ligase